MNRSDALGIAERRAAAQREGKRQLEKLKPGMWVAVQDRSVTEGDQFWLGQAFAIPNRQGSSCVHKAVVDRSEWIAGSEFGRGDFAVAVKWWVKTAADTEERTYEEWAPSIEDKESYGIEYATTGGDQGHYFNTTSSSTPPNCAWSTSTWRPLRRCKLARNLCLAERVLAGRAQCDRLQPQLAAPSACQ